MIKKILSFFKNFYPRFKKLSWKKKILVIVGIIILFSIISGQIHNLTAPSGFITENAKKTNLTEIVTETGQVVIEGRVVVYSPSTGVVDKVLVQNGDVVKEGQTLFTVNSSATQQEQQSAYATYLSAQSTLDGAQATAHTLRSAMYSEWKSFTDLATNSTYETGDGDARTDNRGAAEFQSAQDDWLAAEKEYKDQVTAISAAQAQTTASKLAYEATQNATVKAPADGVVKNLAIDAGSSVTANLPTKAAPSVLSLVKNEAVVVTVGIGQTDIAKIQPGQKVKLLPDAYKNETYHGVIKRVDDIGDTSGGVVLYNVYIWVTDADKRLKSGMTLDAEMVTSELRDVLTVPNSAVVPYKGGRAVRIVGKNKTIDYLPVEVGKKGDTRTQILSGIKEGQEVIVSLTNEQVKRQGPLGF